MQFLVEEANALLGVLDHGEEYQDLRCIEVKPDGTSGRVVSREIIRGQDRALDWANSFNGLGNLYIGRNPRDSDGDASRISSVSFDLDPIYDHSKGSSNDQVRCCLRAASDLVKAYPGGHIAFTGNGALVVYRCSVPIVDNLPAFDRKFRSFEESLRQTILKPYAGVLVLDRTFDRARVVKLVGGLSCKGSKRVTRFVDFPGRPLRGDGIFRAILESPEASAGTSGGNGEGANADSRAELPKVPHKERHKFLLGIAGALRHRGLGEEAIYIGVLAAYEERCVKEPPKDDLYFRKLAKDIATRYAPSEAGTRGFYVREGLEYNSEFGESASYRSRISSHDKNLTVYSPGTGFDEYKSRLAGRSGQGGKPELPTGFKRLDEAIWGLQRKEITTIAGYTGGGKTTFSINVAKYLCEAGSRVLYCSTELPHDRITDKFISNGANIAGNAFQRGTFTDEEKARLDQYYKDVYGKYALEIYDNLTPRIDEVEELVKRFKPDVVFFDHINQLASGEVNKRAVIDGFIEDYRELSRKYNFAPVLAAQLKAPAAITDYDKHEVIRIMKPTRFDLKESQEIVNKTRTLLLVYKTEECIEYNVPVANVDVAKLSYGEADISIKMAADLKFSRYSEIGG